MFSIKLIAGIFQTHILENTGIVILHIASVYGIADFRSQRLTGSGRFVGMSLSADMQTAPCSAFLAFSGKNNRRISCSTGIYLRSLLNKYIIDFTIVGCSHSDSRFNGQHCRSNNLQAAHKTVIIA